ncbi:MAG TPA: hypothetical protein PLZ61_04315 [Candidatus Cryosericum sp.]|nr:hypothetical protein [Candidatus Cryosericum sp.]
MKERISFVPLEIVELRVESPLFWLGGDAKLPNDAIGVLLVYKTEEEAQMAHPGAQIVRIIQTYKETPIGR